MNTYHLLRLLSVPRIGPLKIRALLNHFKTPEAVLSASPRDLIRVPGIERKIASAIVHHDEGERFAAEQIRRAESCGARLLTVWDSEYPELLKRIYDPPPLLFVRGAFADADANSIAVVGTRHPSTYGDRIAERISRELVEHGLTVVSGLARGIDTIAHSSALRHRGRTIAVVGSGLDVPYPSENRPLLDRIAAECIVVSEFPFGTKPDAQNFPRRNRIVSGLCLGTVVVESAENGGAMITASVALDQNREVFAIPGNILEPRSLGTHRLIQRGRAKLVHCVEDILEELPLPRAVLPGNTAPPPDLTLFEQTILDLLSTEPTHVDDISTTSELGTSDTLVALLGLEFKGLVRQLPGKYFERIEGTR